MMAPNRIPKVLAPPFQATLSNRTVVDIDNQFALDCPDIVEKEAWLYYHRWGECPPLFPAGVFMTSGVFEQMCGTPPASWYDALSNLTVHSYNASSFVDPWPEYKGTNRDHLLRERDQFYMAAIGFNNSKSIATEWTGDPVPTRWQPTRLSMKSQPNWPSRHVRHPSLVVNSIYNTSPARQSRGHGVTSPGPLSEHAVDQKSGSSGTSLGSRRGSYSPSTPATPVSRNRPLSYSSRANSALRTPSASASRNGPMPTPWPSAEPSSSSTSSSLSTSFTASEHFFTPPSSPPSPFLRPGPRSDEKRAYVVGFQQAGDDEYAPVMDWD